MIFDIVGINCPLWRRRQQTVIVSDFTTINNIVPPKKIINPEALSSFPTHTIGIDDKHQYNSSSSRLPQKSDNGCIICLDDFDEGDLIRTLPCDHQYHLECIDPWLTIKSALCPLCKYDCTLNISQSSDVLEEEENIVPPSRSHTPNSIFSSLRSLRLQQNGSPSSMTSTTFGPTIRADRVEEFSRSWMARSLPRTMRRQIHEAAQAAALANQEVELPARMTQPPQHIVVVPIVEDNKRKKWQSSLRKKIPHFLSQ